MVSIDYVVQGQKGIIVRLLHSGQDFIDPHFSHLEICEIDNNSEYDNNSHFY